MAATVMGVLVLVLAARAAAEGIETTRTGIAGGARRGQQSWPAEETR